jgi:hypothetical protein
MHAAAMFTIRGLDPQRFASYFALANDELITRGARRVIADGPGYPCRVSLVDASPGDELVLCHYLHHDTSSPYRAAGPIYVRRVARAAAFVDAVPPVLSSRLLSVRAYDREGDMRAAEVVQGAELAPQIERMFADAGVAYLHVHNARPGCFAACVERT